MTLHIDGETHAVVDLKKGGMYRYFEDPRTGVWCLSYAIGEGKVERWLKGQECPTNVRRWIEAGNPLTAHNAGFERQMFVRKLGPLYGFPIPELEQFHCTAAMAAAMALPRDLAGVAMALGLPEQKDMDGRRNMLWCAKPLRIEPDGTVIWKDQHPDWPARSEKLYAYCEQDTFTERAVEKHVRPLSELERHVWLLDQRINERGVPIDVDNAQHARWVLYYHTERLARRLRDLTDGLVTSPGQVGRIVDWLNSKGVDVEKLDKKVVKDTLLEFEGEISEEDINAAAEEATLAVLTAGEEGGFDAYTRSLHRDKIREVLQIRQELSKSSTKKLDAFEDRCSQDRRARDNLMYFAASTGRWGGRGIQLHNMPRKQSKKVVDQKTGRLKAVELLTNQEIEWAFGVLHHRDPLVVEQTLGSPAIVVADMLKGFIKATPGKKLVKGDYSNIEGRVAAWLAGETWKTEAFKAADKKEGPDIYLLTASKIVGCHHSELNKESPERQIGKVAELACGFGGSVGAFQAMAAVYDVTIADSQAKEVVYAWRDEHPAIVEMWGKLEEAALRVVRYTGKAMVGNVGFAFKQGFMWAKKPNGEYLCYVDPRIRKVRRVKWADGFAFPQIATKEGVFKDPNVQRFGFDEAKYKPWEEQVPEHEAVTVMSVNSQTRKWERTSLYGGLLFENLVQAIARDVMVNGMFNLEAAGYPIILTVHDEIISEVASEFGSARQFEELMVDPAPWMAGLPIRAEGDECARYRK